MQSARDAAIAAHQPTVAQRKFAAGIAAGLPKTKAYQQAYPQSRMKPTTLRTKSSTAAKSSAVVAEIERLLAIPMVLEESPQAGDPRALRTHAVVTVCKLCKHSDGVIAMHAAQWLVDYAERLESQQGKGKSDRQDLLRDLRGLYQKALSAPPLVETVAEADGAAAAPEIADSGQNA